MTSYNNWCYGYTMDPGNSGSNYGYGTGYNTSQAPCAAPPPTKPPAAPSHPSSGGDSASARLHNFALQNNLWESYSSLSQGTGFVVTLSLGNESFLGNGTTLKDAKEAAAARALRENTYMRSNASQLSSGSTATSQLHEVATKKGVSLEFRFTEPYNFKFKSSMRTWAKAELLSSYKVTLKVGGSYDFFGEGDHPQKAKHAASREALPYVNSLPDTPKALSTVPEGSLEGKNVIMALNEVAMSNGFCPAWNMIGDSGAPHMRTFTWSLKLGEYEALGCGTSKKIARNNAAQQMLSILPEEMKKKVAVQNEAEGKKKKKSGKKRKSGAISGTPGVNVASGQEGGTNEEEEEEAAPPKEIGPTMPKKLKSVESNGNKANGSLEAASTLPIHQQITSSSPISCLYEYCKKAKLNDPLFECVDENVIDTWQKQNQTLKKTEYTMKLVVNDKTYYDSGPNKRLAKNNVASKAWNTIRTGID